MLAPQPSPSVTQPGSSGRTWPCEGRGATGLQSRATPRKQPVRAAFVPEERSAASSHLLTVVGMDLDPDRTGADFTSERDFKFLWAFPSEKQLPTYRTNSDRQTQTDIHTHKVELPAAVAQPRLAQLPSFAAFRLVDRTTHVITRPRAWLSRSKRPPRYRRFQVLGCWCVMLALSTVGRCIPPLQS